LIVIIAYTTLGVEPTDFFNKRNGKYSVTKIKAW
jgi:hypothetical protein